MNCKVEVEIPAVFFTNLCDFINIAYIEQLDAMFLTSNKIIFPI